MHVRIASWLLFFSIMWSPRPSIEPVLEDRTFLEAKATLDAMAVSRPYVEKDASDIVTNATPVKRGTKVRYTRGWKMRPRQSAVAAALTAGSSALMTCTKATEDAESEATVATCPAVKQTAGSSNGCKFLGCRNRFVGSRSIRVPHKAMLNGTPTQIWTRATKPGAGKTWSRRLFWTLYCTLKKYQRVTNVASFKTLCGRSSVLFSFFFSSCPASCCNFACRAFSKSAPASSRSPSPFSKASAPLASWP
mmetsp:Transcript_38334/g.81237  ORF Transcript_38334/g.81237 Transcript_38334/m.81237 type:complete len:249 (+) Transcript_38334:469-1215(+)